MIRAGDKLPELEDPPIPPHVSGRQRTRAGRSREKHHTSQSSPDQPYADECRTSPTTSSEGWSGPHPKTTPKAQASNEKSFGRAKSCIEPKHGSSPNTSFQPTDKQGAPPLASTPKKIRTGAKSDGWPENCVSLTAPGELVETALHLEDITTEWLREHPEKMGDSLEIRYNFMKVLGRDHPVFHLPGENFMYNVSVWNKACTDIAADPELMKTQARNDYANMRGTNYAWGTPTAEQNVEATKKFTTLWETTEREMRESDQAIQAVEMEQENITTSHSTTGGVGGQPLNLVHDPPTLVSAPLTQAENYKECSKEIEEDQKRDHSDKEEKEWDEDHKKTKKMAPFQPRPPRALK